MITIRAVAVDDEPNNLALIRRAVEKTEGVELIAAFTDPLQALAQIPDLHADLLLSDIEMPGLTGLELAEKLAELPLAVVFVTAYSKYAIDAFRVNAVDYLLKPVTAPALAKTVERVRRSLPVIRQAQEEQQAPAPAQVTIQALGPLTLTDAHGRTVAFPTEKIRELFCYLLLHQGAPADKASLCQLLWPELSAERAMTNFYAAVYQLKKTLLSCGGGLSISSGGGCYRLNLGRAKCDLTEFDAGCEKMSQDPGPGWLDELTHTFQLFQGELFQGDEFAWCREERRVRNERFASLGYLLADYLGVGEEAGQQILLKLLTLLPGQEKACEMLLDACLRRGEMDRAARVYKTYVSHLRDQLGMAPSHQFQQSYRQLERQK